MKFAASRIFISTQNQNPYSTKSLKYTSMADNHPQTETLTLTTPNQNPNPKPKPKRFIKSQIPLSLLQNPSLNSSISLIPSNYSFEIHKTIHRVNTSNSKLVALQFPDGLLMYSLLIADVIRSYSNTHADVIILAEPTYGACCVDDLAAEAVGCDLLVHYGHSCLVPVTQSKIPALYVFVEIQFDASRLVSTIVKNFDSSSCLAIAGTVQFLAAVHAAKIELGKLGFDVVVPQSKPLSAGEVLGCTAPNVGKGKNVDALVFVADGRFHLEAFMIANPGVPAFRFDPFIGNIVLEEYDHVGMKSVRKNMILRARQAKTWGVILGTLGRQGSTKVLERILEKMEDKELDYTIVLMSEISPTRIELFEDSIDAWVQIACPRLSIDWGEGFKRPLLTTFEFDVCMGYVKGWWEREVRNGVKGMDGGCGSCDCKEDLNGGDYPMDYYAQDGGDWNGSYMKKKVNATGANGTVCCNFKGCRDKRSLKEVQP